MALVTQDLTEIDHPGSGAKTNSPLDWSWANPGFSAASGLLLWPGRWTAGFVGTLMRSPRGMDLIQAEQWEIKANKKEWPNQTTFQMTIYFN